MINSVIKRFEKISKLKIISGLSGFAAAIYILLVKNGFQSSYSAAAIITLSLLFSVSVLGAFISSSNTKNDS
jgi:hypothetical protein